MSTIDELVAVSITTSSTVVPVAAFNVPLFVGNTAGWLTGSAGDLIRSYGSLAGVLVDFANTTPEYKAAKAAFAIPNPPATLKIGKAPAVVSGVSTITLSTDLIAANVVNGTVNGTAIAPVTYATSHTLTWAAVAAEIAAIPGIASAVAAGDVITVTAVAGYPLSLTGFAVTAGASQPVTTVAVTTPQVLWSTGLAAIRLVDSKWYGFAIADNTDGAILDVAGWAESNPVLFAPQTAAAGTIAAGATDVASLLQAKVYERCPITYHALSTEYAAFEALCLLVSYAPGAASLMYKALPGITPDPLTESQAAIARGNYTVGNQGKNLNIYTTLSGITMYEPGIAPGGQFVDLTIGMDWLKATLQADILALQAAAAKIPYTDAGVALFEAAARKRIKLAQDQGIVATVPAVTFTVPLVASLSDQQRAARIFPPIAIVGNLQGAVNAVGFALTLLP